MVKDSECLKCPSQGSNGMNSHPSSQTSSQIALGSAAGAEDTSIPGWSVAAGGRQRGKRVLRISLFTLHLSKPALCAHHCAPGECPVLCARPCESDFVCPLLPASVQHEYPALGLALPTQLCLPRNVCLVLCARCVCPVCVPGTAVQAKMWSQASSPNSVSPESVTPHHSQGSL